MRSDSNLKWTVMKYKNILNEIMGDSKINQKVYDEFRLNECDGSNIKEDFKKKNSEIEFKMHSLYKKNKNSKYLLTALFAMRGEYKVMMYADKKQREMWTRGFKIMNFIFFAILNSKEIDEEAINIGEKEEIGILIEYYTLAQCYLNNIELYSKLINNIDEEKYNKYMDKMNDVSNEDEDMYIYEISCSDFKTELKERKLSTDILLQKNINRIRKFYYSKPLDRSNPELLNLINRDNLNNNKEDMIIIKNIRFVFYEKRFKKFVEKFSPRGDEKISTTEAELVFAYSDEENIYISKKMMETSQSIINFSLKSQLFTSLLKYYFDIDEVVSDKNKYNKILTYKIADVLYKNHYIIPLEKKEIKKEKIYVPLIEIKKYPGYKDKYGDIDILFISPYTNKLYNLEYKNYQMMITDINQLTREIEKVKDDKVVEKTLRREKLLKENLNEVINKYFKEMGEADEVKSIILSTKPNYYLCNYNNENISCYDWIEFKEKIEKKLL